MSLADPAAASPDTSGPYDLLGDELAADPAPLLHRMRREAPVHWDPILTAWVLTRHDDVRFALRDEAFSVDRGGSISRCHDPAVRAELAWCSESVLRWMVFADPPRHTRVRAAVRRAFTSTMVEQLRPSVEAATAAALASVRDRGRIEVLADLAVPVPAIVTADLLGLPRSDIELLKQWTVDMFALFGAGVASADTVRAAHRSLRASEAYFTDQIAHRRRHGGTDLIASLCGPGAESLDDRELVGLCITMVAGAYETTTHVVGNGLLALLRHPAQLERLRADPSLAANAVEEIFRFDGPAVSVVRRARRDVPLADSVIGSGQNVYCMLYAANRDPDRCVDPDRFDIGRRDPHHLGLGHGIHFCLGAALARLEAQVMLNGVLRELPDLALDRERLDGEPRFVPNLAIRGLQALPLRFSAHRRS
jgi:pimeloyl-[acyl-carrier protein] synthase